MLTIEQVHENNVVAKKWLEELIAGINEIEQKRARRKEQSWKERILYALVCVDELTHEMQVLGFLKEAKMHLDLYFKYHYNHAAILSKVHSPVLEFSVTKSRILYEVEKTYRIKKAPHEIDRYA